MKFLALGLLPLALQAGVITGNLLTNPGAETGDLTGWTIGGPGTPVVDNGTFDPGINPHTGSFDFNGHSGVSDSLAQTVSILVSGITPAMVDAGTLLANLGFWEQGLDQGAISDNADVQLTFLDGSSATISSVTSPLVDSHNLSWQNYANSYAIPVGTRSITYTMQFFRNVGTDSDSYIDDNVLTVGTPVSTSGVPEPATGALWLAGAAAVWIARRRRL